MGIESQAEARAWRYVPVAIVVVALAMMLAAILVTGRRAPVISRSSDTSSVPERSTSTTLRERIAALPVAPGAPLYSLDIVDTEPGKTTVVVSQAKPIVNVTPDQSIALGGWAVDGAVMKPDSAMYLEVDGRTIIPVAYGLSRPDVGTHFANDALAASGFHVTIPPDRFGPGVHRIDLIMIDSAGTAYRRASDRLEIHETR
jgi:hypothetical protein